MHPDYDDKYGNVYDTYDDPYYYHDDLFARDLEEQRERDESVQRAKAKRLGAAVQRECSGCGQAGAWHDPDDYMCIVCRDGRDALPDGAHWPGMTTAA